ncbi:MAG TPA: hypothetical protein VGA38_10495 [Candidatus Limnocylindria bacterium]
MDITGLLAPILIVAMLGIAASRNAGPMTAATPGERLLEVRIGLLFRALAQRVNIMAVLIVLAIGSGAFGDKWISPALFTFAIIGLIAVVLVPARYVFTTEGISTNRATFRPWSDFSGWTESGSIFGLHADGRFSSVRLYVGGRDHDAVKRVLTRYLGGHRGVRG